MDENPNIIEGQASDPAQTPENHAEIPSEIPAESTNSSSANPAGETTRTKTQANSGQTLKDAWKQVENIGQTLGEALQGRGNVVMVRVNDDTLAHLDMLVEAELARSRSEAAALLISEGMKANQPLFGRIREITDKISALRSQLRVSVQNDTTPTDQTKEGAE